ncbi:EndoU domain-containing protein, partial [Kitasatospora putterlickiae]|uniref:EndoU domain-containing protein n=1 Tax=Kitasatospora putterlickiae TaxID=221725 RepID=UPI0031D63D30
GGPPRRPRLGEDVLRRMLEGRSDGSGGHLYPRAGSDRPRPVVVEGSQHRNGTFRVTETAPVPVQHVESAGTLFAGPARSEWTVTRTMFPRHWSSDDAAYAAEQAYQSAVRGGRVTERYGTHHWTGEYGGIRIEGTVVKGEFTSFRPAADQDRIPVPAFGPPRLADRRFDLLGEDHVRFGDRQALTGVHSRPDLAVASVHGVWVDTATVRPNDNGTYRARVWYLDPTVGPEAPLSEFTARWFRRADDAPHTMYPDGWTPAAVRRAVDAAYQGRPHPRPEPGGAEHWVGEHDGVRIEGITRNGVHLVHRPTVDQPISHWRDTEVVERSAAGNPVVYGVQDSELTVRHVRFAAGQQGLELHVPVRLRFPADATPQQTEAYRAAVQSAADRFSRGARDSQDRLVRVVADFVDHDGPGHRTVDVTADVPAAGIPLRTLMPDLDNSFTTLRDVADYAGEQSPAEGWAPHGGPRPAAAPLRAPDGPGTAERPETVSRWTQDHPSSVRNFALADSWLPEHSGLPAAWSRADAFEFIGQAVGAGNHTSRDRQVPRGPEDITVDVLEHRGLTLRIVRDGEYRVIGVAVIGDPPYPPQRRSPEHVVPEERHAPLQPGEEGPEQPAPERPRPEPGPAPADPNSRTGLRPDPDTRRVRPPVGPRAEGEAPSPLRPYEVRRGLLLNGDPVTELVLRVRLDASDVPAADAARVTALRERVHESVARAGYNGGHRLPDGNRLQVRVEFVESPGDADHTVRVHRGTVRQDEANWGLRAGRETIGHEIGRVLGLHDGPLELHRATGAERTADWPRRLRTVGAAVDEVFAPDRTPDQAPGQTPPVAGPAPAAAPPRIADAVRDTALYGPDGEDGTGGSMLRPSVDLAYAGQLRTNPNDTVTLPAPAGPGGADRTFFPRHWSTEEILYAVEQAHLDSRRYGTDASSPLWMGEYAGVFITGTQRNGEVTGFRPHHGQGDEPPPPYAPRRPLPPHPAELTAPPGFGDRRALTPLHHRVDPGAGDVHGVRTETVGAPHPNGTRRAHTWYLDPSVAPDSPLADFPGRWHRSADGPQTRLYPEHWTRQGTAERVEPALLDGRPRREVLLEDRRTRHVVTEVDGVRVEGLVRDGRVLVHRPTEQQPDFTGGFVRRWDDAPVLARSEPVTRPVAEDGPELTARRVVFATGQEGVELTVRLHLAPGDGMTGPDVAARGRRLQEEADRLTADLDPFTPVSLRLDFTDDPAGAFSSVRLRADRPTALEDHLGPLLRTVDEHGLDTAAAILAPPPGAARRALPLPEPVAGTLRAPGTDDPSAPPRSTDLMRGQLTAVREAFTDAAWARPALGVPSDWTPADARYAAYRVLLAGTPDPRGRIQGEFAGRGVVVFTENGRITGFRIAVPLPGDVPAPPPGTHRVLATAEVRPAEDAFRRSLAARDLRSFEATRVELPGGDTETVLRMRIHLDTADLSGLTPAERESGLLGMRTRVANGLDEQFNRGQRLPGGDLLRFEVLFVDTPEEAHHTVAVHPTQPRASALHWDLVIDRSTLAHELGHLLGLPDEYREAAFGPRPVYQDGGLMAGQGVDTFGRFLVDHDDPAGSTAALHPAQGLPARYLRELGSAVDEAFGPADGPAGGPPRRAAFGEQTLRTALDGADGTGGHLYPGPGTGRTRPPGTVGPDHPNGTFQISRTERVPVPHLESAGGLFPGATHETRTTTRTMFPRHWTSDEAAYAAEQAYQSARRTGRITERDGTYHWTGEYAGVRVEGEVANGEFTGFRPAHNQDRVPVPAFEPPNHGPRRFAASSEDHTRFGDRHTLTGVHTRPTAETAREHGLVVERLHQPHDNGTYRAQVWYLDPRVSPGAPLSNLESRWLRRSDDAPHVMYPDAWSRSETLNAVHQAYRSRHETRILPDGTESWTGRHQGVVIEGLTRDGVHLVHRPSADQPVSQWRPEEIVRQSAPRQVDFGGGFRAVVRHVRFGDGQSGLGIIAPVPLRFAADLDARDRADYRAAFQRRIDQELGNLRDADGALVRVVADLVETDHPGAPLVGRGSLPGPRTLLPHFIGDHAPVAQAVEHARRTAPAEGWTAGRPDAPPLREPRTPGTDERPATVSRTETLYPRLERSFALPDGWTPRDANLPAVWSRQDALSYLADAARHGVPVATDHPRPTLPHGRTAELVEHLGVRVRLVRDDLGRLTGAEVLGGTEFPPQFSRPVPPVAGSPGAPRRTGAEEHLGDDH